MPDIIQLLPDAIANQIAAGEVIQRPASAVKELLENAIDAGADDIHLIIKDAGKTLIQVVDNGCGMSDTDARLSFERHATSKIRATDDLFNIRTMGFRGEALASIAAIAQVELKTRPTEAEVGTQLLIEGSEVKKQEPVATPVGTSLSVKNLFYNTPARRNFLKSKTVETRHIIDEFQRVALAYPELSFRMHHNGMEVFHLPAGNLRRRIINIFGNNYNERLVPVEEQTPILNIQGFIGKPEFAKKTRGEQYFFVNNRYIKSPYLQHAIMGAYADLIPSGSYPLFVLFLELDPKRIDINVHPTKQEVKFEDEKIIYAYLNSAVKRALGKYSITPSIDFEAESSFEQFGKNPFFQSAPQTGGPSPAPQDPHSFQQHKPSPGWEAFLTTTMEQKIEREPDTIIVPSRMTEPATEEQHEWEEQEEIRPYQFHYSYIFATIKAGMIIIDQQAAHERVLFERYLRALQESRMATQKTLFPQTLHLTTADAQLLKDLLPEVNALGFDIQEFGQSDFVVHGLPADMEGQAEQKVVEGLLEQYKMHESELDIAKRENLARSLAAQMAIKKGKPLSEKEMRRLIDELFACQDFYKAPNGNRTFVKYTVQELEQQFQKKR